MRIDKCRKCGMDVEVRRTCQICLEPIKFTCKKCHVETDERIHSVCTLLDMNYQHPVYEAA